MMSETASRSFVGSNILVTGGAGFVGSNLVKILLTTYRVSGITIVDNLLSAEKENIPVDPRIRFLEGSIADNKVLSELNDRFDYIFHLATYHGNQSSIHDPIADHDNNTLTTLKLLERVHRYKKLKALVYASAGCSVAKKTFENPTPTSEEAAISLEQDSPYSLSKIFGEFYCAYYYRQYQFPAVRARFQNVYGPGEVLGAGQWRGTSATVWRNVTPTFIYKALKGMPLPVENEGAASRDFIYVEDICRGLLACAAKGKPGDVYNLASGRQMSILHLANIINELTGNPAGIEYIPKRPWDHSGCRYGSTEKSFRELNFQANMDLREGLTRTLEWTRGNMDLIEQCISKHAEMMKRYYASRGEKALV